MKTIAVPFRQTILYKILAFVGHINLLLFVHLLKHIHFYNILTVLSLLHAQDWKYSESYSNLDLTVY